MDGPLPKNSFYFSTNPIGYDNEINPTKRNGARSFFCSSCRKRRRRSKLPAAQKITKTLKHKHRKQADEETTIPYNSPASSSSSKSSSSCCWVFRFFFFFLKSSILLLPLLLLLLLLIQFLLLVTPLLTSWRCARKCILSGILLPRKGLSGILFSTGKN